METDDLSPEISDFSSNQSMSAEARGQQSHDIVDKDAVRSAVYVFDFPSQDMKDHLASPQSQTRTQSRTQTRTPSDVSNRNMLFNGPSKPQDKYMRLDNELEQANQKFIEENQSQQQLMIQAQDEQIDLVGASVGVLKNMSQQISGELDEQAVMLDDFAHEMDTTESKMDNVMKKMAKVLHMSNDKRQWCAIGVLLVIMVIVIILFFVL